MKTEQQKNSGPLNLSMSHRPTIYLSVLSTGKNQVITKPTGKFSESAPVRIKIDQANKIPIFASVLDLTGENRKLSIRSNSTLCDIVESFTDIKNASIEELNELRKNPVPNIMQFAESVGQSRNTVYESLDLLTREINGLGYYDEENKRFIYFIEGLSLDDEQKDAQEITQDGAKGDEKKRKIFLKPVFSMSFMEDVQKNGFITLRPTLAYRKLDAQQKTLDRYLRNNARIQWQSSNPEFYTYRVETLFGAMNREKHDKNRRDKERIQRPFLKDLQKLYDEGIFLEKPFFRVVGTKTQTITLKAAIFEPWNHLLNMEFVYKIPPPGLEETRVKNKAFKAKKNVKTKDAKVLPKKTTNLNENPLEESMDLVK